MANITIQNLEVESNALNQVSPGEMEKVVGGEIFDAGLFFGVSVQLAFFQLAKDLARFALIGDLLA
jgi:hypothetical protein